jgi:uncharacterized protein (DUF1810 family)
MTGPADDAGGEVFRLDRFVEAQAPVYDRALAELRRGRKQSHWMWYVFPQLSGLGSSPMAQTYAIGSAQEAGAYLAHPLLGSRLHECTEAVLAHRDASAEQIFGDIDARKFRSSMTLFEAVASDPAPFAAAIDAFYAGRRDGITLGLLGS